MHLAAAEGQMATVRWLLRKGVAVDGRDRCAVDAFCRACAARPSSNRAHGTLRASILINI